MARRKSTAAKQSLYSVHPGVAMVAKWVAELPEKTGRSMEEWIEVVEQSGLKTVKERREWLKSEYKLGTNTAWWLADRSGGIGWEDGDAETYLKAAAGYVEKMYVTAHSAASREGAGRPLRCATSASYR